MISRGLLVLIGFVVIISLPACETSEAPLTIDIITTGPIAGKILDQHGNTVISGPRVYPDRPEERRYNEVNNDQFPQQGDTYTALFEIEAEGPVTLLFSIERDTPGGFFPVDLGEATEQRALFLIDGPVGAHASLTFSTTSDVDELLLTLDEDRDGQSDADIAPIATARGEDLGPAVGTGSIADVEEVSETVARVTLRAAAQSSESGVIYAVYPDQPQLQEYDEPILVTEGSLVIFAAYDETASLGRFQDLTVLGGIAPDIELELIPNGELAEIRTIVPGQNTTLTFSGVSGEQVELVFSDVEIGYENCCQARVIVLDPDGQHIMRWTRFGADGLVLNLTLEKTGTYTMHVDPELQHLLSTAVTLQ